VDRGPDRRRDREYADPESDQIAVTGGLSEEAAGERRYRCCQQKLVRVRTSRSLRRLLRPEEEPPTRAVEARHAITLAANPRIFSRRANDATCR
jgi:hypothetical protein